MVFPFHLSNYYGRSSWSCSFDGHQYLCDWNRAFHCPPGHSICLLVRQSNKFHCLWKRIVENCISWERTGIVASQTLVKNGSNGSLILPVALLYRDQISEFERNEVDFFGRSTQDERTEIKFGRTRRVEICCPISRIETELDASRNKNIKARNRSETVALFRKFSQFDTFQSI